MPGRSQYSTMVARASLAVGILAVIAGVVIIATGHWFGALLIVVGLFRVGLAFWVSRRNNSRLL